MGPKRKLIPRGDSSPSSAPSPANDKFGGGFPTHDSDWRELAERYRSMVEQISDWIWEIDSDGTYTYVSPAVTHILGYTREELIGKSPFDLMPPEEAARVSGLVREAMAEGKALVHLLNFNRHRDGHLVALETNGFPVRGADGRLRGYLGVDRDVTDRQRAEEARARSEAQYRILFEQAVDGIVVDDPDGRLIEVNGKACSMTGYAREDLIGRHISMLFPPEELAREPLRFDLMAKGEEVVRERPLLRKDGSRILAELHSRRTPDGNFHTILTDISARKQTEEDLRRSEGRLRSIFRAAPVGIGVAVNRVIMEVNERLCDMLGYTAGELVRLDARVLYPTAEEYEAVGRIKYRQIEETGAGLVETRWRRKDGTILDIVLSSAPIEPGNLAAGVTFTALDITERKRAEVALRESEERYRSVYETAPIAFVLWDTDYRVIDWNRHAERIFGWPKVEVLGKSIFEFLIPPDAHLQVGEVVGRVLQGELPSHSVNRNLTRDGRTLLCEWHNAIRLDGHGRIVGVTSIGADITEQRRLEEKVQQTQRLESLGILAGGIAHDFNNLLMAVLGHADLARRALSPLAPGQENLDEIIQAARRAADLCRQMLAYSGRGRFLIEPVDVRILVEEMVHLLRTSISKKASLQLQLEGGLPPIEADASQIRQVVMNLVLNASEALGDREGAIAVTAGRRWCEPDFFQDTYLAEDLPGGEYVCIEVADTGCGMDAETIGRLFEPFFTTKFTGRGLGLAAVLGIVRGHKGALTVESRPGLGSTFRIYFPAKAPARAATGLSADAPRAWTGAGETVLLVDDEETIRSLGIQMLRALGLEALTAADGAEAVRLYRERGAGIACVLVDLTMPRMDGVETLHALRALNPAVRIILSSGYTEQEMAERFPGPGPDGFIQKPYTLDILRDAVRTVLPGGPAPSGK